VGWYQQQGEQRAYGVKKEYKKLACADKKTDILKKRWLPSLSSWCSSI